ncbi:MAG: oxidoreductase [Bacteroidetes bacterium HGW-Bacteroidetes-17]|jgi:short-subunit dehydrogenase|nr:MAG: oxidoreductase [Bacteroidetes bacterium HGW-Bacteroidetes-17]
MKKAIVIGATSGIGEELAKLLTAKDYKVGITGKEQEILEKIQKPNPEQTVISPFDCTKDNNSQKITELVKALGGLDLLIFSAGIGNLNKNLGFKVENLANKLNVLAFNEIADWSYRFFEDQGHGHFVAISSISGLRGSRVAPAYNASKAYQINYLEGLRQKAKKSGKPIYITDIRPGFVDTDFSTYKGKFWVSTKEKAVKQIYNCIKNKKDIGYITKRWFLIAIVLKLAPNFIYKRV